MLPKPKNIIIFVTIGLFFALLYAFFFRGSSNDQTNLVSSNPAPTGGTPETDTQGLSDSDPNTKLARDFLALLLNIKTIKLNDAIFTDPAFLSLHDSSIVLIPDGNEGRPNPFAPIGVDVAPPAQNPPAVQTPPPATPAH